MICTSWKPASSRPARMAPTRPSIMSDGAMMSAPASAWSTAWRDQQRDRLVVEDPLAVHQAVMAVAGVGVERHVGDDADLRHGRLDRAHGAADEVAAVQRLGAASGRAATDRCRGRARWPGCRARRPARPRARPRRWSGARRPASRRPASRPLAPSIRKIGQIRSSTVSTFSRTSRRDQSALRLRRGRWDRFRERGRRLPPKRGGGTATAST